MPKASPSMPCPKCLSAAQVVPIVYGLPTEATARLAEAGAIALGGCEIVEDEPMPQWRCKTCGIDFDGQAASGDAE